MADRYWVGGSGTWNTTSTTNWASSSGGTAGASAPTAADNVFFDGNSNTGTGAFTVTVSAAVCNDFNAPGTSSALDGAMTLAMGSSTLTVSGSWTNQATNFAVTNTAGTLTFNATTTGKTITTNGVTVGVNTTLNGVGGAWTLGSALNISTFTLTLTNGTFDTSTSNYSVTTAGFSSSNSNTRTITLNGSTITISGNSSWDMVTSTNATLNAGTSTITLSSTAPNFSGGGLTYYNVSFTSTTATALIKTITGANTFNNLTFSTIAAAGLNNISISANQIINGTLTVNGSNGNQRMFVQGDTVGSSRTLTCAAIAAMTDVDFRDITIAGAAGTLSGTRLGDCGGNSNITFVAGKTVYWSLAAGGNWNANGWAASSGASPATTNYPLPQDTAIIENTGLNTSATITINANLNIGTLDSSTRTNAMTLASGTQIQTFYGNFTYGSGVTPSGTQTYNFSNRSTKTLNSGGITFTQPITINSPGGGIQLLTNNLTLGTTLTTTLTQGTLDLNNLALTTGLFSSANSNTRTIAFGTGNISCSGTGTVWTTSTVTGLTTTGTQVVNVTSAGSTAITVIPGAMSEANSISFNFTGGTYSLTFLGTLFDAARNVDFTGFAGTLGAPNACQIYGNLKLSTGMSLTAGVGDMNFKATSGTKTITSNGKTMDFPVVFNGVGGTWQLQDAMTVGTTRNTTLTNGTLNLGSFTLTTGLFKGFNSNIRTIAFGTGNISCSGTGSVWDTSTSTNLTTTGTQVVNITSSGSTAISVFPGPLSEANSISYNFTGGTYALTFLSVSGYAARNVNFTGYAGAWQQINFCTVYGNLTLSTGMSFTASAFSLTFGATSGTKTITSNGKTLNFSVIFNGIGGTWQLQDNMTVGSATTFTNGSIDLTGNSGNWTLTTATFASANTNTRSIAFGTGQIAITGNNNTVLDVTATNLTATGTPYWNSTYTGATGTRTFTTTATEAQANSLFNVATSGTSGIVISTAATDTVALAGSYGNINLTGFTGTLSNTTTNIYGNLTLPTGGTLSAGIFTITFVATSGTKTITSNGRTMDFNVTFNGVGGTWQLQDAMTVGATRTTTLTNGTVNLVSYTLSTGIFSSVNTNTRAIAFGTGGITLTTTSAGSTVLNMSTATGYTSTGTSNISAAMSVTRTFNFASAAGATTSNRPNLNLTSGASVPTLSGSYRQINFTGSTCDPGAVTISCHGFTLASGGTYTSTNFTTVGTGTITYTGKSIDTLNVNTSGITTTLGDAGQNVTLTLTNGTLDLAGFTMTCTTRGQTASGTKNLTFNGGTLAISGANTTAWNNAQPTNFTTTAGTGTGTISMTAATAKTFVGGGSTYNCTLNQGGAGALTITGSNTFNNITNTTQPASVLFTAATTNTFNNFSLSGTAGNLITIGSVTAAQHTLSKSSGTVSVSYCSISYSNATGGATWDSLYSNGNLNGGNNTGWNFGTPISGGGGNFFLLLQ